MQTEPIEESWIDAFVRVLDMCRLDRAETVIVLVESTSRALNVKLAELALARMKATWFRLQVPSPATAAGPLVRSTGASGALDGQDRAVAALGGCGLVIDLTVEGLMHAAQTAAILKGGARILTISNEHPEALARLVPDPAMKATVKDAVGRCRSSLAMEVRSEAGTDLAVDMRGAATVGVWGWTDRPGTLAHWPGGVVVSFPGKGSVNGRLVFKPGDVNLAFKRYFETTVTATVADDFIVAIDGEGADARLMRAYLEAFDDRNAYATSHVGWGLDRRARYEALTIYDKADSNGTELRAVAGNFLYSTGANEFAGRFTRGHFDLPMMDCTIALDGAEVVREGALTAREPDR